MSLIAELKRRNFPKVRSTWVSVVWGCRISPGSLLRHRNPKYLSRQASD